MAEVVVGKIHLLTFDDELLSRSSAGTVWGRIYFDLGSEVFPERGWSDMAVAITVAWLEAVRKICGAVTRSEKVAFMDGPLSVSISLKEPGFVKADFFHRTVLTTSTVVYCDHLLSDAISAGEHLISICVRHGWTEDPDFLRLRDSLAQAIKLLPH